MNKKFIALLICIFLGLTCTVATIVKYNTLLSKKSLYALAGTQENYAWAIAKFSIQLSEFYEMVSSDDNIDDIKLKLDILYSRVNIIRNRSESTEPLYKEEGYEEVVESIYNQLEIIEAELSKKKPDFKKVNAEIAKIKPVTKELTNIADHAEVGQRTRALKDFQEKRRELWGLLIITIILVVSLAIVLWFYFAKINRLLVAERAAFDNKNAFLGVVGHELRTSLQAIMSSIDSLSIAHKTKDDSALYQRLDNAASKMERQMRDLSEFAKVDNGNVFINQVPFMLDDLISNTVQDCIAMYKKEGVLVDIIGDKKIGIISDPLRVMQVVENVVSNAFKYTIKGHVVIAYSMLNDHSLTINVTDTGQGIAKNQLQLIYKPFVRASNNDIPGFGMGLAIVSGVLRAMKGSISIKSAIAQGTEVCIKIPVTRLNENQLESVASTPVELYVTTGIRVLVVDDNEMACSAIASLLTHMGFSVEHTTSPQRALQKLFRKNYDLILSDLQMPLISGVELYKSLRSKPGPNLEAPVIFISAFASDSPCEGVPLLMKPVRHKELGEAIGKILS